MPATQRYVCDRCRHAFESDDARCPKCLRKSSVRAEGERASSSEAARIAAGDHTQTDAGRRSMALVVSIALSAALCAGLAQAWTPLAERNVAIPALVAVLVVIASWISLALAGLAWRTFAARCALSVGVGAWALVCGVLAQAAGDLSLPFTVLIGLLLFFGGVIPVLRWMQRAEEPAGPPTGKWR